MRLPQASRYAREVDEQPRAIATQMNSRAAGPNRTRAPSREGSVRLSCKILERPPLSKDFANSSAGLGASSVENLVENRGFVKTVPAIGGWYSEVLRRRLCPGGVLFAAAYRRWAGLREERSIAVAGAPCRAGRESAARVLRRPGASSLAWRTAGPVPCSSRVGLSGTDSAGSRLSGLL